MSVDTTCATVQRRCRSNGKVRKNKIKRDLTSPTELSDVRTPQIHIDDDLGFDLLEVSDIPEDMLFPGEYNVYLQDKLKSVCEENKHLSVLVKERDEEMTIIKNKLQCLEEQLNDNSCQGSPYLMSQDSIRHADMAACRVMELTKQVCELTAQLEEQKGRCALAETKLLSVIECQEERQPASTEILTRKEAEIKTLSDKLHVTNSKLFEGRNKIQHLQQEIKNAHKVLLSEVGDGIPISDILSSGGVTGGWRGRAQQIQILQQRVTDLTERLRKCCDYRNLEIAHSYCGDGKCTTKERKASLEVAQQETRIAQQQLNENLRKLDAAKARIKVLESESTSCRVRLQLLTDKASRDDDFIQILQGQVNQLESALHLSKDESRLELKKSEKYYQQLLDDQRIEKQRSIQLLSSLEEKEKKIKRLEDILFDLKDKELNSPKIDKKCDGEMVDIPTMILCPPLVDTNQAKDNSKVLAAEIECKKLLELAGTVNRRLNDARHECDKHKSALRIERQRLARLEAKLARQETERIGSFSMSKRQIGCNSKKAAATSPLEANSMSKEELQDKLELLQEEVLTLKARLSCLEQEKEDDLRAFGAILNGSSHQTLPKPNLGLHSFLGGKLSEPLPEIKLQ